MRVAHLTSVHPRYDTRIFVKECRSLLNAGYEVCLVVADGRGDELLDGVSLMDVGASAGRLSRVIDTTRRVCRRAVSICADLYHLHDPELLPVGIKLKKMGKRVIFDSHEDVAEDIRTKSYIPWVPRMLAARAYTWYESYALRQFDGVVAATPFIRDKLSSIHSNTVDINNFPIPGEVAACEINWANKCAQVCYVGYIGSARGIREVIRALPMMKSGVRLQLAGSFSEIATAMEVRTFPGWRQVDELGFVDRQQVREVLGRSVAGLVTLHPTIPYKSALPVKMFEYMSAGVPVIASDFPLWREIIEGNACGICVNPLNPSAIAEAIDFIVLNPVQAEQMGRNGRRAVESCYNWVVEEGKLLKFYDQILRT